MRGVGGRAELAIGCYSRGMRSFFLVLLAAGMGCSSSNFDVTSASSDDAATAADNAVGDDARIYEDSGNSGSAEGGAADGNSAADTCSDVPPTPPCITANNDYTHQVDTPRIAPVTKLYKGREILLHVKMPRAGRLGKVILRMTAVPSGITTGGVNGYVTVTAYRRGCTPILLGKSALQPQTGEDWAFYFNDSTTVLPTMPAGTDVDLVVTTDSTNYKFDVIGSARPSSNPYDLYWGMREGSTGAFTIAGDTVLSCMVWTYAC